MKYITLGGLGARCNRNAPCDDIGRVAYRLEYYTLVWFEHNGKFNNQTITIQDYLEIIYQSWLQLIMIDQNQNLNGQIFKKYGMFGTKWFIAFGGSDDSRAKQPETKYFLDCRFNCDMNFYEFVNKDWFRVGYSAARSFFLDKPLKDFNAKLAGQMDPSQMDNRGVVTLKEFIRLGFEIEFFFYQVDYNKNHRLNMTDNMLHMLLSPVTAAVQTFVEVLKYYEDVEANWKSKEIKDLEKQVIKPVQQTQENKFKNEAIMYGGFGVAGLVGGLLLFKGMNKDGGVKLWQWGILAAAGVVAGRVVYNKYNQQSTYFKGV